MEPGYSWGMIHQFFPTQIWQAKLFPRPSSFNRQILKECYKFRELDQAGQKWSKKNYPGGYTSYASMTNMHERSSSFAELREKINEEAWEFSQSLEMNIRKKSLKLCSFWLNIMPAGVSHPMHIHPHAVLSGTYYLQMPKGARGLKLEDPRLLSYMATPPRKLNARRENQWFIEISPQAGEVLLFESWLKHEVPSSQVKGDRVSVSFNYHWV
jgi:uncharacterized protein (TIGR02466 family)